ncbi:hypothetical protein N1557_004789, partial [Escherichia coli]|nr:hypothetical protein [Escherichia coli]ELV5311951.1 hypothetical protein [Escherichia coli]
MKENISERVSWFDGRPVFIDVPGVGALFGELAEENRVFIEKTKRDELALRKSIAERDARIRQGEMGYINRSRATGVSKGP